MQLNPTDRAIARRLAAGRVPDVPYESPYKKLPVDVRREFKPAMRHLEEVAQVTRAAAHALESGMQVRDEGRRAWNPSRLRNGHELLRYAPMHLRRNGLTALADEVGAAVEKVIAEDLQIVGDE